MRDKWITIGFLLADVILLGVGALLYQGQDRTAPAIEFPEEEPVYTPGMSEAELLAGVTASDREDGDVTDALLIEKISDTADGNVMIVYAALDSSNNVSKRARICKVGKTGEESEKHTE